jgi:adenosylhomocysteine nucleosidase
MTDLAFDDPCILFALRRESKPFLKEFRPHQRFPGAPCWARFCGPAWLTVLVLETGVGAARTAAVLEWLLSYPVLGNIPYRPKVVLSAGFSGALPEERRVGDVILATEVSNQEGKRWSTTWPGELPAGEWRPPLHRGRVVTTAEPAATPDQKRRLAQQYAALAVDMETATVASLCSRRDVPFGCVRVISDDCQTSLSPQVISLLSGGSTVSLRRVFLSLLRSPKSIGEFRRLAKQTRLAADQLSKALGELLTLTLPWGTDL